MGHERGALHGGLRVVFGGERPRVIRYGSSEDMAVWRGDHPRVEEAQLRTVEAARRRGRPVVRCRDWPQLNRGTPLEQNVGCQQNGPCMNLTV